MGTSQSAQNDFFWLNKGELQLWTYSYLKAFADSEPKSSIQNNDSIISNLTQYTLVWQTKSNQIQFVATRHDNDKKIKFSVDQMNGKFLKSEPVNNEMDELSPQLMWKCWVEIWMGQSKKNDLILNNMESQENAQLDCQGIQMKNPSVKLHRQRNHQIQVLTRQLYYSTKEINKYQISLQYCKAQIWIFNWDLKKQIVPDLYLQEFVNKLQTESLSFYQNTLH